MRRGKTERETCDLNGWGVGTRLVGDEGYGPSVIRVTYFTQDGAMLAVNETYGGDECFWTLGSREWSVTPTPEQLSAHCPCGCPPESHVGGIGCRCGTLDEPPCTPRLTCGNTTAERGLYAARDDDLRAAHDDRVSAEAREQAKCEVRPLLNNLESALLALHRWQR